MPTVPGSGSSSEDYVQSIVDDYLLFYFSDAGKSKILAEVGGGISTKSVIINQLEALDKTINPVGYGTSTSTIDETLLNNLVDGGQTTSILITNLGTSSYARITISITEDITPTGASPIIRIRNPITRVNYDVTVSTTTSGKKIVFNNIPEDFCSEFVVINNTGVTLPSFGNSISVQGL